MVSVRHLLKESRMFTTQTGGKGCAGVGVTVTGRICDIHVPWPAVHGGERDKKGQVTCSCYTRSLHLARFI